MLTNETPTSRGEVGEPNPRAIAASLTKAQREALRSFAVFCLKRPNVRRSSVKVLLKRGLVAVTLAGSYRFYDLTALGLAVRSILQEKGK
jgi:hypothetical protein